MSRRLDRIRRLLKVKEQQRDVARGHLAEATRAADAAVATTERAEDAWHEEAARSVSVSGGTVSDFAATRDHLVTLQIDVERARGLQRAAEHHREGRHDEAREAQVEVRQIELWSESEEIRQRTEGERREQRNLDELAARRTERGKR